MYETGRTVVGDHDNYASPVGVDYRPGDEVERSRAFALLFARGKSTTREIADLLRRLLVSKLETTLVDNEDPCRSVRPTFYPAGASAHPTAIGATLGDIGRDVLNPIPRPRLSVVIPFLEGRPRPRKEG